MRIIAGEFRGRKILPPAADTTRPITDRVKQSLFDILTPLLDGSRVYDCFAGTGSMGLECLSRGAAYATFFEADRSAVGILRKNIESLGVVSRSRVVDRDLFKFFAAESSAAANDAKIDLIFLDPPYRFLTEQPQALQDLAAALKSHHLSPAGTIIFRHDVADALTLPALAVYDVRTYGSMTLEFLRGTGDPPVVL